MTSENETGSDLFARLLTQLPAEQKTSESLSSTIDAKLIKTLRIARSCLNLDSALFPNSVHSKDIIEILGKVSTGKTELVLHLIARLLLPPAWTLSVDSSEETMKIDLREHSSFANDFHEHIEPAQMPKVLFINTDAKVFMLRLFTILEKRVARACQAAMANNNNKSVRIAISNQSEKFVKECLRNLIVYNCYSNEQFIYSLAACETFIQSLIAQRHQSIINNNSSSNNNNNNNTSSPIVPIFIDTINSNFEIIDKYNTNLGVGDADHTENYATQLIKRMVERYDVCVIATRSDMQQFSNEVGSKSHSKWQALLNKRVELSSSVEAGEPSKVESMDEETILDDLLLDRTTCVKRFNFKVSTLRHDSACDTNRTSIREQSLYVEESKTASFTITNAGFSAF